jgi:type I restriction enzyme S subunit
MTASMNVPQLRFPEFSGEWVSQTLSELIEFKSGYAFSSTEMYNEEQKYQLIKMSNVYQNILDLSRSPSYLKAINKAETEFLLCSGDVVLTLTGTVGKKDYGYSVIIKENDKFLLNQRLVRLRNKNNISSSVFIRNLVLSDRFLYKFFIGSKGGTGNQSNVSVDDLKQIKLPFPSLPEQTKIASFLSAVDTKIDQLTQKKALLEAYKKGAMQQIFSQQIRFTPDEGGEYPEWEEKKLGEITKKVSIKNKDGKKLPVYSISNKYGFIPQDEQFDGIDSNNRNYDISLYKIINKNTFAYNPARINVGSIGYSGNLDNVIVSSLYVCFTTNRLLSDNYLLQHLNTFDFNKQVLRNTEGGVRDYLFYENFSNIKMNIPCLEEQTKIANFLSTIDRKIDIVSQQLEQAKAFKKGLLQQMFV